MEVVVIDHSLVSDKLTRLRDIRTTQETFRSVLDELSYFLIYEALQNLELKRATITTPVDIAFGRRIDASKMPPLIVPVLRAGLGMLGSAQRLLPNSNVGFIGLSRDEVTFLPNPYLVSLPAFDREQRVLVLDPMLATGNSLAYTCELLAEHGAKQLLVVCVVVSSRGLTRLETTGLDIKVVTAAIDKRLNDQAYIVPGLGDAGDRLYGIAPTTEKEFDVRSRF